MNREEKRSVQIELRALDGESRKVGGYAMKYNTMSEVLGGWMVETIARGAFDDVDMSDVIATFNHNFDTLLGRTSAGTLTLELDDVGLRFELDLPNTRWGDDCLAMIRRGDLRHCSFIFIVDKSEWVYDEGDYAVRTILKVDRLLEISLVVFPAYKDTEVSAEVKEHRSLYEARRNNKQNKGEEVRDVDRDREYEIMTMVMGK